MSSTQYNSTTRPLDAIAAGIVVVLCLSWGFNQVATKLAIHGLADCQCGYTDPRDNHFAQLSYDYTLAHTSAENRAWPAV